MINLFVEKCDEYHLPYYFKFDLYGDRDDTIVIYSSTEDLAKYIEILQEIKKEHPDLVSRAKEPPILTGKIDNWIGYGSNPSRTPDGRKHSFNEIRANAIESAISKKTKQWIMNHKNKLITYQGKKLTFQNYIAMKSAEKLTEELEKKFVYYDEIEKKSAQDKGITYNQNNVSLKLGYTWQDLKSPKLKENIYKILCSQMETCLTTVCNGTYRDMTAVKMNLRNGKTTCFSGYDLEKIIQSLSVKILNNDSNFIKDVQSEIISNAKKYGIDTEKFCFDIKAKEKMKKVDEQKQINHPQAQKVENNTESDIKKENINYSDTRKNSKDNQQTLEKSRDAKIKNNSTNLYSITEADIEAYLKTEEGMAFFASVTGIEPTVEMKKNTK